MKVETKVNIYNGLIFSIIFGLGFTIAGGLITNGVIDWPNFPITALVGIVAGFVVSMIIPGGKIGLALAGKAAKPDTFLFKLIMYAVLLLSILLFMCPILTLFVGRILMGAPVTAVLPDVYSLFIPFFVLGLTVLMIFGGIIMKLAMKCAGVSGEGGRGANEQGICE